MEPVGNIDTITVSDASVKYDIPLATLRYWREKGKLTKYKRGNGDIVFDEKELAAFVAQWRTIYRESN